MILPSLLSILRRCSSRIMRYPGVITASSRHVDGDWKRSASFLYCCHLSTDYCYPCSDFLHLLHEFPSMSHRLVNRYLSQNHTR
ncbi:uncharacterized protein HD556DRAFT_1353390 [Suillus plorans]|uniref:Uncharacterized protein n=1 Tax=Suillus plorans TaxID=116603 RepID=A0A9P7J015_9AGAM|nr:uncharacterized protein HD556DRAFT_1353390 [Suillus plorans]KAG1798149.1 hypothetical protein HD556DRAFT_1353390 [Suillus plorans]